MLKKAVPCSETRNGLNINAEDEGSICHFQISSNDDELRASRLLRARNPRHINAASNHSLVSEPPGDPALSHAGRGLPDLEPLQIVNSQMIRGGLL